MIIINKTIQWTRLCEFGSYVNIGTTITLLQSFKNFPLIAIRHGWATNNTFGGGQHWSFFFSARSEVNANDIHGLTGTLNGYIYNLLFYYSSLTSIYIIYNYGFTNSGTTSNTMAGIREVFGVNLG